MTMSEEKRAIAQLLDGLETICKTQVEIVQSVERVEGQNAILLSNYEKFEQWAACQDKDHQDKLREDRAWRESHGEQHERLDARLQRLERAVVGKLGPLEDPESTAAADPAARPSNY